MFVFSRQIFKVYLVSQHPLPPSVQLPEVPPIALSRLQILLRKASTSSQCLSMFGTDFLVDGTHAVVSTTVRHFLRRYRALFMCREHFNEAPNSDVTVTEAQFISVQFCQLLRQVDDYGSLCNTYSGASVFATPEGCLDEVLCSAIILFFLCTTPSPVMIKLGKYWRHSHVIRLKAALTSYMLLDLPRSNRVDE